MDLVRAWLGRDRGLSSAPVVALAIAGIAALMVVALLLLGRSLWCACGYVALWHGDVWSDQNSQQLTDPYTFTHVTHGFVFYVALRLFAGGLSLGTRAVLATALESTWEVLENTSTIIDRFRTATIALQYYGDSVVNSLGDVAAALLGFWLAARLPTWLSIAAVLVLEVGLALWIRDNFVLNVVMLIAPIEAVRQWQQGGG
ncbi:MAG: DUF2585 family protein [Chloroflexi bacterium]|nr:DUF2585 family protein [Chloroflexota bacterium]